MSEKHKLVPVEPTPEMIGAGRTARTHPAERYKAMLAAAPAVRGELVGWVWHSYNQTNFTSGSHHKEVLEAEGVKLTPVYTAPHPAEQQPAPDMPSLAEALRQYQHNDGSGLVFGYDRLLVDRHVAVLVDLLRDIGEVCRQLEMPSERAISEWADRIDAALAAHRKQGG